MPSLFERAAQRCEQNILRLWPAWRQAHLTPAERPAFEAWKAANVEHMKALRSDIVAGETPDIDRGWPDPRDRQWTTAPGAAPPPVPPVPPPPTSEPVVNVKTSYTFDPAFLEKERKPFETSQDADLRLLDEYESLEVARPLDAEKESRRRLLFDNFYEFKG